MSGAGSDEDRYLSADRARCESERCPNLAPPDSPICEEAAVAPKAAAPGERTLTRSWCQGICIGQFGFGHCGDRCLGEGNTNSKCRGSWSLDCYESTSGTH